ncbi:MAG: hypothetical protein ACC726_02640 [Chloroflexota bacterium]
MNDQVGGGAVASDRNANSGMAWFGEAEALLRRISESQAAVMD